MKNIIFSMILVTLCLANRSSLFRQSLLNNYRFVQELNLANKTLTEEMNLDIGCILFNDCFHDVGLF